MRTVDQSTRLNRGLTDENLSAERTKVDGELAARANRLHEASDAVVELARQRAEVVLRVARARAEAVSGGTSEEHERVAQERAQEDRVLADERATSDETLAAERELRRQALSELLASERLATDDALVNERRRADDSQQRRDDVFAMVSHDSLNLLSSIALNAALIAEDADVREVRGQRIIHRADAIRRASQRMEQLAHSLLDVASIEAGMLHLERRAEDAARVVREVVLLFEPVAAAQGLSLTAEVGTEPLHAMFDPQSLTQVLTNLLTNAIKFTSPPGTVSVRATRVENDIEFAVTDTGCGIAANEVATIFERFTRAHGARFSGHGLGLYISREFVAAHGGQLTVESEVGRGSTFKFRIAAVEAYAAQSVRPQGKR